MVTLQLSKIRVLSVSNDDIIQCVQYITCSCNAEFTLLNFRQLQIWDSDFTLPMTRVRTSAMELRGNACTAKSLMKVTQIFFIRNSRTTQCKVISIVNPSTLSSNATQHLIELAVSP